MRAALPLVVWLWAAVAAAQGAPFTTAGSELGQIRIDFEYGKYKDVLSRARNLLDRGGLTDDQLAELHRLAGVAAFNQGQMTDADRHLATLLRIDPDASLDPFLFPPPAVSHLEKLKKEMEKDLEVIRQERRIQADRRRRDEEDRQRALRETEEMRRKIDDLTRKVTVRTVERRVFLVNFMPFGAGQFQQGRNTQGVLLAVTEGALAAISIVSYFAYGSLARPRTIRIPGVLNPDGTGYLDVVYRAIPESLATQASVWRIAQYASGLGFYAVYGYGVIDAVLHHEDQVVTTSMEEVEPEEPPPPPDLPPTTWRIVPPPAGLGAAVRFDF
jgi:hypothetical protein